ncbi:MAG: hypothetical protein KTR16_01570 [Acidiferrobacterales bacterium]|nr:hypothetical protein [Acidiferrobacterales bacterium]
MESNQKEKKLDEALLAEFDLDPHLKITTSLTMAIHRQLMTLSDTTGVSINDMDREFILEKLANVKVTDTIRNKIND